MSGYLMYLDEVWCLANVASILISGGYHKSTASCAKRINAAHSISRKMLLEEKEEGKVKMVMWQLGMTDFLYFHLQLLHLTTNDDKPQEVFF